MVRKYIAITLFTAAAAVAVTSCGTVEQASYVAESGTEDYIVSAYSDTEDSVEDSSEATSEAEPVNAEPVRMPVVRPDGYEIPEACILDVECVMQNPELPTGCEITSLTIALNYCGFDIDKVGLCDKFLFKDYYALYTFEEAYVGDPKANNGYGCYAPVIVETADKYFESFGINWHAVDLSDTDFCDLFYQIEQGRPVIIWTSMDLRDTEMTFRWATEDGDEAWFADLEHCMVLTGYDLAQGIVYAADPLNGNVEYSLERFEECYEMLWKRAVVLCEDEYDDAYDNYQIQTEAAQW